MPIPAAVQAFFLNEWEAIEWAEKGFVRFCEHFDLSEADVYSQELCVRYRELGRIARQEWALNTGGRL